jgi:hypothetical protein
VTDGANKTLRYHLSSRPAIGSTLSVACRRFLALLRPFFLPVLLLAPSGPPFGPAPKEND